MKSSIYTIPIEMPENGILLLYNTRSGALLEFPLLRKGSIEEVMENPPEGQVDPEKETNPLIRQLTKSGFLIPDELDELTYMESRYKQSRENRGHLSLTIAPTVNCNFRCVYCYQMHPNKKMSQEVQDALVERVRLAAAEKRNISVTWFGGEPLLALEIVESLSKRFMEITEEQKVGYSAWMITNGYLLSRQVAEKLKEIRINRVQVTLDGPPDVHDSRRFHVGGKPTFDTIVKNFKEVCDFINISLRINCDRTNSHRVLEVLDTLEATGLKGRLNPYLANVRPYTEVCADIVDTCMKDAEFSLFETEIYLEMFKKGWGVSVMPQPQASVCIADKSNGMVIDPEGRIYRCWNDMTRPKEAVEHLLTVATAEMDRNRAKWTNWTPFILSACRKCKMLPLCIGGCLFDAMKTPNPTHGSCTYWKYNLKEIMLLNYHQIEMREFQKVLKEGLKTCNTDVTESVTA
ncbi:MAG: radical SAM protein [Nitrospirota bacterium]